MTLPIRVRMTIWYATVLALVLVAFSAGVLWMQDRFSRAQFDEELTTLEATIASAVRAELAQKHQLPRAAAETHEGFNIANRTIAVLDGNGKPISAHWRGFRRANLPALNGRTPVTATVIQDGMPWRVRIQRETSPDGPFAIFVAASETPLVRAQRVLGRTLLLATPCAVLLAALVCWWAASRALHPVIDMSQQAERITLQSLDSRLSGDDTSDEVSHLRSAFNHLLDRVSAGVSSQRRFMADASHELRTPVTAARTAAEVTLDRPHRDEDEYREALSIVAAQTRRLGRMVDDMLTLARADVGGYRLRLAPCALDRVLEDCAETATVLAAAKRIVVVADLAPAVRINADAQLVRQLTLNLLDNAIKQTPDGGLITLTLRVTNRTVEIAVDDTGLGIPAAERDRIFERFVRLDEARDTTGGAGLGLPIARWIAQMHRGTLQLLHSGPAGSRFVARLPL